MPHSPRWYAGRLWLLESGKGAFGYWDFRRGRVRRGRQHAWLYALVSISPIVSRLSDCRRSAKAPFFPASRSPNAPWPNAACGVWVVDLQSGQIVAFLKFEDAVQEVFAVQVLPGLAFPELVNDNAETHRPHLRLVRRCPERGSRPASGRSTTGSEISYGYSAASLVRPRRIEAVSTTRCGQRSTFRRLSAVGFSHNS